MILFSYFPLKWYLFSLPDYALMRSVLIPLLFQDSVSVNLRGGGGRLIRSQGVYCLTTFSSFIFFMKKNFLLNSLYFIVHENHS